MQRGPVDSEREAKILALATAMREDLLLRRDIRSRLEQARRVVLELYAGNVRAWRSGSGFDAFCRTLAGTISQRALDRMMKVAELFAEAPELEVLEGLEKLEVEHVYAVRNLPFEMRTLVLKEAIERGTTASAFRARFTPSEIPSRPGRRTTPPSAWIDEDAAKSPKSGQGEETPDECLADLRRARARLRKWEHELVAHVTATLGRTPSVVVVDAEGAMRLATRRVLMQLAIDVRECTTAEEALALTPGDTDGVVIAIGRGGASTDEITLGRTLLARGIVAHLVFVSSYIEQLKRARSAGVGAVLDTLELADELAILLMRPLLTAEPNQ